MFYQLLSCSPVDELWPASFKVLCHLGRDSVRSPAKKRRRCFPWIAPARQWPRECWQHLGMKKGLINHGELMNIDQLWVGLKIVGPNPNLIFTWNAHSWCPCPIFRHTHMLWLWWSTTRKKLVWSNQNERSLSTKTRECAVPTMGDDQLSGDFSDNNEHDDQKAGYIPIWTCKYVGYMKQRVNQPKSVLNQQAWALPANYKVPMDFS